MDIKPGHHGTLGTAAGPEVKAAPSELDAGAAGQGDAAAADTRGAIQAGAVPDEVTLSAADPSSGRTGSKIAFAHNNAAPSKDTRPSRR